MTKIQAHLFRQVLQAVVIIVGGLVMMALLAQGLSRTDLILENRQSALTYFYIVMLGSPQVVALLTPMAIFVGTAWALNRIHKDSEIVVAQAAGMTRWQVASPILRLGLLCAVLHLGVNLWGQPMAQRTMREAVAVARADLAAALIRPGQFTTNGERLTFYAREQVGGELRGVLISDMTDPDYPTDILARSAALVSVEGRPTLLLRDALSQQLDTNQQLSILEFDQYMFDLTEFMKEDAELILKASDKFLYELFFVDRKNYFENKEADTFLAEAHARLTTPLLNIVMALLAIVAILGGDFSRQGYGRRISYATGAAAFVLVVQLALQSAAADDPALNIAQWAVPLGVIGALSWIYFRRGRHIGRRATPGDSLLDSRREAIA
ncbi:MAG: LptF/LptG family permease [Hyphomonas sp.]|uniref:LptF/LptG family permease n=1 Tax=Hyphomonas sp. TaxID=87 RepID=UPI001821A3BF|nr:LptF/LptG family permease [Hyphomonas sp.]MBA3070060.1 LptF/LptG family permease [Hyphomonas sp.]MBU3921769.1 LptF/LptG family permease [Alphaproteobacteria bacterium]MBU4060364.1 LptF/LptG family permease [Alphaproteobacteria bacterium]MBU4163032.1 LptF/LptG family permease [Alphaproteobacteria bacterium]